MGVSEIETDGEATLPLKGTRRSGTRFSLLAMLCVIAICALCFASYRFGFQAGANKTGASDLLDAAVVSMSELDAIADGAPVFYQGSTATHHYIRVVDVGFVRLRRSEVTIPSAGFSGDGSSSLGLIWKQLTIENGKLRASDAPSGSF